MFKTTTPALRCIYISTIFARESLALRLGVDSSPHARFTSKGPGPGPGQSAVLHASLQCT
ncbi:hypothetical protein FIBSPDRAFT_878545 [Athelia psychrophila]|uniref:Uncharacterized protein n=1 Tax=Athelia psychrophila TaxID=1759441 RepID=A0A167UXG2_9AGAM|nr:hypothetical protein FIBSPDRAFT_878545 [Fibularhizoctonia sp. CBS 109695]